MISDRAVFFVPLSSCSDTSDPNFTSHGHHRGAHRVSTTDLAQLIVSHLTPVTAAAINTLAYTCLMRKDIEVTQPVSVTVMHAA
jgi:hypothetical protein